MIIQGDEAKDYKAVRLDSFKDANAGELVYADDQTGEVRFKDIAGEVKSLTLGLHAIRIIPAKFHA